MANIPELLDGHVTLEVECLDRLYLNGYIGGLVTPGGLVTFMRVQLGKPIPSPVVLDQVSEKFREAVKAQAERERIPVHQFQHKERKDDIANEFRRQRGVRDRIVFIGVAQEKAKAFSGTKVNGQFRFNRDKTVYVNHYYFLSIDDDDFGPLFIKVCRATRRGESNCASTAMNGRSATTGEEKDWLRGAGQRFPFLRRARKASADLRFIGTRSKSSGCSGKWLKRIPLPLRPEDRRVGYEWDLSIWQMEVSLTQIFDRPLRGREFFEETHPRQSGSQGRPDRVQLVFDRVVTKKTPGEFRTRVIQDGVHPSLHINYKNFDLKQYFKEGRGCRTEGTFRNPNDFGVNKGLSNLPYLQKLETADQTGVSLEVERVSHNSGLSGDSIQRVVQPTVTDDGEKAPALKFGQPRVMALFLALTFVPASGSTDSTIATFRQLVTDLLGVTASEYTTSQMTGYDLPPPSAQRPDLPAPRHSTATLSRRMAGRWPACSHASKLVYSDPPLPCSPAMTPSCLSRCGHLLIASTTNLIN